MERTITQKFESWKNSGVKKPLVVIGARQVGKTYIIRAFGEENYKSTLEINFQDNISARNFFSVSRSSDEIADYLKLNYSTFSFSKDNLIFFDEVQLCPELITSLKFLPEKLSCDFICSGSMLGIRMHKMSSWPVGYVEILTLNPMTFPEFILACGIEKKYIDRIKNCISTFENVPDAIHDKFNALFTDYMICGGLPEAVEAYINGGIADAVKVNRRLANDYRMDIAHYAESSTKIKAEECFDAIPLQLAKDNKKFQYSLVKRGGNARHYEESLSWLENAGLIIKTYRLSGIEKPLDTKKEPGIFKVYMFDSGILVSMFSDGDIYSFLSDTLGTYKGLLYENVFATILNCCGIKSYYYEPNTSSEIDFVVNFNGQITPIEVKSGMRTKSKSFDNFIKNHSSKHALRFSRKNIGISNDGITMYLPVYTAPFIFESTCDFN